MTLSRTCAGGQAGVGQQPGEGGAYGAGASTLVLIRPDGYVALISDAGDVSAVAEHLDAIGWYSAAESVLR
jgi:hypothetical protein